MRGVRFSHFGRYFFPVLICYGFFCYLCVCLDIYACVCMVFVSVCVCEWESVHNDYDYDYYYLTWDHVHETAQ